MNGELYDLCRLALHANKALANGDVFEELDGTIYVLDRRFVFSEGFGNVHDGKSWYRISRRRGLKAVRLLMPVKVENRSILGFSNTSRYYLVLFRTNGSVACLVPHWEFDQEHKGWHVTYRENEWPDAPKGMPVFEDVTESFRQTLKDIRDLAEKLGEHQFASWFQDALTILEGTMPEGTKDLFPEGDPKYRGLINAAAKADVFGAMGSWNDTPAGIAYEKGLKAEYDRLSDALLRDIRTAMMYAVSQSYTS